MAVEAVLGSFQILGCLGVGGMGEVYRARDTRLGREVAIKVLPASVAKSPARVERFEREARLLASLSHPNIAAVYGFDVHNDTHFLVMELIEGVTLVERLGSGPLPWPEVVRIAEGVAWGLEAAHERGVIHRDLKPGNVKVTPEGEIKVLDFGLAKSLEPAPTPSALTALETESFLTQEGVIMGTPAYMSPEQSRGQATDERSDIFAFGSLVFELLTGSRAFKGVSKSDIMAAVLLSEPDWLLVPEDTPIALVQMLRRCLAKDPTRRLRDMRDIRLRLQDLRNESSGLGSDPSPPLVARGRRFSRATVLSFWRAAAVVFGLGLLAALSGRSLLSRTASTRLVEFELEPDDGELYLSQGPAAVLSPDGTKIVYTSSSADHDDLWLRELSARRSRPLPGTSGGRTPFFSPDSRSLGFVADGKLKTVDLAGGTPRILASATIRGASWGSDDRIVFIATLGDRWPSRIAAGGGAVEKLAPRDQSQEAEKSAVQCAWPFVLPGAQAVLYTEWRGSVETASVAALSTTGEGVTKVADGASFPRFAQGHVFFSRPEGASGALWSAPFDTGSLRMTKAPTLVVNDIRLNAGGAAHVSISEDGTLAYIPVPPPVKRELLLASATGLTRVLGTEARDYRSPRFSPDGRTVAVTVQEGDSSDVWLVDVASGKASRFTLDGRSSLPVFSPDGRSIVYASKRNGPRNLYLRRVDAPDQDRRLTQSASDHSPHAISPDGKWVTYDERTPLKQSDLMVLNLETPSTPVTYLSTPTMERASVYAPDGKSMAFLADASGASDIYLRGAAETKEPARRLNLPNASPPVWSRDGKEIFWLARKRLLAVTLSGAPPPRASLKTRTLFEAPWDDDVFGASGHASFDIRPGSGEFVAVRPAAGIAPPTRIVVALGWLPAVQARLAGKE